MKIGISLPTFAEGQTPEHLSTLATAAEEVGAASLWAPERVVLVDVERLGDAIIVPAAAI